VGRPHREKRHKSLALELEAKGYDWVKKELATVSGGVNTGH